MKRRLHSLLRCGAGALALCAATAACGEEPAPEPAGPPSFEHYPVVAPAIAELEAALGQELPPQAPDDELTERLEGLVTFLESASGGLRDAALDDARSLDPAAAAAGLTSILGDPERSEAAHLSAASLLGALEGPHPAAALLALLEDPHRPAWLRAQAAWQLGLGDRDWVLPRLVLRQKYEKDRTAFVWLGVALARLGNHSAVAAMLSIWEGDGSEQERQLAGAQLVELASAAGRADARDLEQAWRLGPLAEGGPLEPHTPTPRLELELWRRVAMLSDFQLRGVDDSRYIFERSGAEAAPLLARALHDEDPYISLHSAQSLERMGPRAAAAAPELVAALNDSELAPHAAAALGRIAVPETATDLLAALAPGRDLGLRVAAARALGQLQSDKALTDLRALVTADEPDELRQAAAESLVYLDAGREVLELLMAFVEDPWLDPMTSEYALRWWIADQALESEPTAELLVAWDAVHAAPEGIIADAAQREAARAERVALLRAALAGDLGE